MCKHAKLETTHTFINEFTDKHSNKKDYIHNNMDESQNNYAEQKKPDKKYYILYFACIGNFQKHKSIYSTGKQLDQWFPGTGDGK